MNAIQVGIIGIGNRAKSLVKAATQTGKIEITAFTEINKSAFAEAKLLMPQATGYFSYEEMLEHEKLDAVIIATPNDQHVEAAIAAFKRGLHVFCEKPMAPTSKEWDTMIEQARVSGKILQIGMELRYSKLMHIIDEWIEKKNIGEVKLVWIHEFRPPFKPGADGWRLTHKRSGGTLLEKNCHHFDIFNMISRSRPITVFAMGNNDAIYSNLDILDRAWVVVEYENGIQACLGLSLFHHHERLRLGIQGTDGSVEYDSDTDILIRDNKAMKTSVDFLQGYQKNAFDHPGEVEQMEAFASAVLTGNSPPTDGETARWSHIISIGAEMSVRTGKPVHILPQGELADES